MKSTAALDREIKAVEDAWNAEPYSGGGLQNHVASAVYHALRWARGYREVYPSVTLRKKYGARGAQKEGKV